MAEIVPLHRGEGDNLVMDRTLYSTACANKKYSRLCYTETKNILHIEWYFRWLKTRVKTRVPPKQVLFTVKEFMYKGIMADWFPPYYSDVIMSAIASLINGIAIVCSTVYSGADHIKTPRHWRLGEFTGDRWIPRTMGQ